MDGEALHHYTAAGLIVFAENPGVALREFRLEHGVSQTDVADRMGVGSPVVCDYERGRRQNPGVEFVRGYVEAVLSNQAEEQKAADGDSRGPYDDPLRPPPESRDRIPPNAPQSVREAILQSWGRVPVVGSGGDTD